VSLVEGCRPVQDERHRCSYVFLLRQGNEEALAIGRDIKNVAHGRRGANEKQGMRNARFELSAIDLYVDCVDPQAGQIGEAIDGAQTANTPDE